MLATETAMEMTMAIFQTIAFVALGLASPRYFLLLLRMKKPTKAMGSINPQIADVGMAIQGPIYFQSTTPTKPGAGSRHASR